MMYTGEFKRDFLIKAATEWNNFNKLNRELKPSNKVLEILKRGVYYLFGRDTEYRPCIMISLRRIILNKEFTPEDYVEGFIFITAVVKRYMLFPHKVEQVVIVIDALDIGLMFFPIIKTLHPFMKKASKKVGCIVSKGIIIRPSWMFGKIVRQVKGN